VRSQPRSFDWRFVPIVVAVAVGASFIGRVTAGLFTPANQPTSFSVTAPESITYTTLDGSSRTLWLRGSRAPRLVLVLSVDCPVCEKNMANWKKLVAELDGVGEWQSDAIIALTTDPALVVREYLTRHELEVPVGLVDREVFLEMGVSAYPTTLIVQPEQELRAWAGLLTSVALKDIRAEAARSGLRLAQ